MSPIIPHLASECLEMIGEKNDLLWPKINENLLVDENINFVIQINGKTREILNLKKETREEELLDKVINNEKLNSYLNNKKIKRKIFIPNKLMNIITN